MITSEELRDAFHYLYPDELPELKFLVQSLPDNPRIVNIGAGAGTSCLAMIEARDDSVVYSIDIQDGNSPLGSLYSERKVFEGAGIFHLSGSRWFQVIEDSKETAKRWLKEGAKPLDMVFIDGDHSYEGCSGDIMLWTPMIKSGGLMSIHDYNKQNIEPNPMGPHPGPWPGVNKAVDELIESGAEIYSIVDSLITFRIR